ncbi:hypothetical protein ACWEPC_33100 [Nonomuraea sp. NPDC004297]
MEDKPDAGPVAAYRRLPSKRQPRQHVSLHKSLLGTPGAVLAADAATVATARTWRQRLGGGIRDAWPLAQSVLAGLDPIAGRMPAYREHAIAIAAAVNADGAARAHPDPPQTPIFHIHLPAPRRAVEQAGRPGSAHRCTPRIASSGRGWISWLEQLRCEEVASFSPFRCSVPLPPVSTASRWRSDGHGNDP